MVVARSNQPSTAEPIDQLTTIAVAFRRALPCDAVVWASVDRTGAAELVVWAGDEAALAQRRRVKPGRVAVLLERPCVVTTSGGACPDDLPLNAGYLLCLPMAPGPARGWLVARATPFSAVELDIADLILHGLRTRAAAGAALRLVGTTGGLEMALTAREGEMLDLVSRGLTAAAIGRRAGISARTVHKHLQNAYAKLGCSDRISAVGRFRSLDLGGAEHDRTRI